MKTLEDINLEISKLGKEIEELRKKINSNVEYSFIKNEKAELINAKASIQHLKQLLKEKELEFNRNVLKLKKSRMFDYEEIGKIISNFLTLQNDSKYFFATRLVKHTFQIDEENRPFYHIVSFVSNKKEDLQDLLLDRLSGTMIIIFNHPSLIIKPLDSEMNLVGTFEKMLRRELEVRGSTSVYVATMNDIPELLGTKNLENKITLPTTEFGILEDLIEEIIAYRYQTNSKRITKKQIMEIINSINEKVKVKQLG